MRRAQVRKRRLETASTALAILVLVASAAAQQIRTGEEYALHLQRTFTQNGYDIEVNFYKNEHTLSLISDEFRNSETREATVRELTRDAKTMCGLGIWYVKVGYSKGFLSSDVVKSASVGCSDAKAALIADTAGARPEIAEAVNDPDGSGFLHARVDGTTLVVTSEHFFDNPQTRSYALPGLAQSLLKDQQKLCKAQFTRIQFRDTQFVKNVPLQCR